MGLSDAPWWMRLLFTAVFFVSYPPASHVCSISASQRPTVEARLACRLCRLLKLERQKRLKRRKRQRLRSKDPKVKQVEAGGGARDTRRGQPASFEIALFSPFFVVLSPSTPSTSSVISCRPFLCWFLYQNRHQGHSETRRNQKRSYWELRRTTHGPDLKMPQASVESTVYEVPPLPVSRR